MLAHRLALAVPYDMNVSGTIIFANRLAVQLIKMGYQVMVVTLGGYTLHSEDFNLTFDRSELLFQWVEDHKGSLDILFWCGFFLSKKDRIVQVKLSERLTRSSAIRISFLWESTGNTHPLPEEELVNVIGEFAKSIVALNESHVQHLLKLGIRTSQIQLLSTGVDTRFEFQVPTPATKALLRTQLNWPLSETIFLILSRLTKRKRISEVIDLWDKYLCGRHGRLVIVGSGFGAVDSTEVQVMEKIHRCKGIQFIRYESSMVRRSFYQAADCFISAGSLEGEPTTLVEAMACGLPTIASRGKWHSRLVKQDVTDIQYTLDGAIEIFCLVVAV